jgi:hypothetical protein
MSGVIPPFESHQRDFLRSYGTESFCPLQVEANNSGSLSVRRRQWLAM